MHESSSESHKWAPELAASETGHVGSLAGLPGWRAADNSPSSRSLPWLLCARASPAAADAKPSATGPRLSRGAGSRRARQQPPMRSHISAPQAM